MPCKYTLCNVQALGTAGTGHRRFGKGLEVPCKYTLCNVQALGTEDLVKD